MHCKNVGRSRAGESERKKKTGGGERCGQISSRFGDNLFLRINLKLGIHLTVSESIITRMLCGFVALTTQDLLAWDVRGQRQSI